MIRHVILINGSIDGMDFYQGKGRRGILITYMFGSKYEMGGDRRHFIYKYVWFTRERGYFKTNLLFYTSNFTTRDMIFTVYNSNTNSLTKYKYSIREHHERFYKNITIIIYNFKKITKYNKI